MTWTPIVGKKFSATEFDAYLRTLSWVSWRPRFVVVHNTSAPTRAQYQAWQQRNPPVTMERWLSNLVGYYRDQQHWSAGPHWFVAEDGIGVFTPPTHPGVHTPSWNAFSIGVETVGEYEEEAFDGSVRDNLIASLASIHTVLGLDPADYQLGVRGLHFHKEDVRTTHKECPGKHMVKADLVAAVANAIATHHDGGDHQPERPKLEEPPPPAPGPVGNSIGGRRFEKITMTEFGGRGDRQQSAYGGYVDPTKLQFSLPARVAANRRMVRASYRGNAVVGQVNDLGPWNLRDDYWNSLEGRPAAESQHALHQRAQNGEVPSNPAGIDATPAVHDALGITGPKGTRSAVLDWWEFAES